MSRELGLSVLQADYRSKRIPVMEHIGGISRQAIRHFTGIDPLGEPEKINEAFRRIAEIFEIDLNWGGGFPQAGAPLYDWEKGEADKRDKKSGELVQWGLFAATRQEDGRHFLYIPKPNSVEEALAFEPLKYFPKSVEEYRIEFETQYRQMLISTGDTCYPLPQHYTTCFHWPLAIFGFELLCLAGIEGERRFGALMERFAEASTRITTAWSQVKELKGFILHDDLTIARGPIFSPDWYRRYIFPHYRAIFHPLVEKGIPIIFTSDGNCTEFVDDIFAAGAEGLNFEYLVDIGPLVERYPEKILIGNINSSTLARGPKDAIEREVRHCMETGSRARRFVVNVGGGLTHDIPVGNLEFYLGLRRELARTLRC